MEPGMRPNCPSAAGVAPFLVTYRSLSITSPDFGSCRQSLCILISSPKCLNDRLREPAPVHLMLLHALCCICVSACRFSAERCNLDNGKLSLKGPWH